MTVSERKEASKYLKHGDKKLLAGLAGVDPVVVGRWLRGLLSSSAVEPYFEALVEKRKAELQEKMDNL